MTKNTSTGVRTQVHQVKSLALYRLSYRGSASGTSECGEYRRASFLRIVLQVAPGDQSWRQSNLPEQRVTFSLSSRRIPSRSSAGTSSAASALGGTAGSSTRLRRRSAFKESATMPRFYNVIV